jgi:hypothetical protein
MRLIVARMDAILASRETMTAPGSTQVARDAATDAYVRAVDTTIADLEALHRAGVLPSLVEAVRLAEGGQ